MNGFLYCLCAKTVILLVCLRSVGMSELGNKPKIVFAVMGQDQHRHLLPYLLGFVEKLKHPEYAVWLSTSTASSAAEKWFSSVQPAFHASSTLTNEHTYEAALRYAQAHAAQSVLFLSPACLLYSNSSVVRDLLNFGNQTDIVVPKLGSFPSSSCYNGCWRNMTDDAARKHLADGDSNTAHMCFIVKSSRAIRTLLDLAQSGVLPVSGHAHSKHNLSARLIENVNGSYGVHLLPSNNDNDEAVQVQLDLDRATNLMTLLYASEKYDVLSSTSLWPRQTAENEQMFGSQESYINRVVVVNLDRRPDRLKLMKANLDVLGKVKYELLSRLERSNTTNYRDKIFEWQ